MNRTDTLLETITSNAYFIMMLLTLVKEIYESKRKTISINDVKDLDDMIKNNNIKNGYKKWKK